MANALPQAIGAQATGPGRQVIALAGDGGLAMLLGELPTLRDSISSGFTIGWCAGGPRNRRTGPSSPAGPHARPSSMPVTGSGR
jgi:hypothetical protein